MISIPAELKEAFNPNGGEGGRYIDYDLTWGVLNEDAQSSMTPAAAQETALSRISQIANENYSLLNIATFEKNGIPLNGSCVVPPRTNELSTAGIGLVMPALSGAGGAYGAAQTLTITFPYPYSWLGFTVDFGLVPAADFTIQYMNGAAVMHTTTVTGNTDAEYADNQGVVNCDKVIISITESTLPYHRVRIARVMTGVVRVYDKNNSEGLQVTEVFDPLNERAPAGDLKISVDNFAEEFNIFDPGGIDKYLQQRQKLRPRIGAQMDDAQIGYVDMGAYYLQAPELKNNFSRMELRASNLMGVLQDTFYTKGVFKTATLAQFVRDVAEDAGVTVVIPSSFDGITLATYIPTVSHAEAFRRFAQAGNAYLWADREQRIVFSAPNAVIEQMITKSDYRMSNGLNPSDDTITNTAEVEYWTVYIASAVTQLGEVTGAGTHTIKYNPSTQQYANITGGQILSTQFYADNAVIEISGGTASVFGYLLVADKATVSATNKTASEAALVYTVKDNPMIQAINAPAIAQRYLALKAVKRRKVKMEYRGYPYLCPVDCVGFDTGVFSTQGFVITKNALKLGGGMTGTLEAREAVT